MAAPICWPARMPSPVAAGIAEAPVLVDVRQVLFAPGQVVVESAGGQDRRLAWRGSAASAVFHDDGAGDRAVGVGDQSCVIGESSQSGMPRSFIASRSRAASDCPMAAIRSPNTRARIIRQTNFSRTALPAHDCRT